MNIKLSPIIYLLRYAGRYKLSLVLAIFGSLLLCLAEGAIYKFIIPNLVSGAIDIKLAGKVMLGLFCFGCGELLSKGMIARVARAIVNRFRQQILHKILLLPLSHLRTRTTGSLSAKIIYDVEQIAIAVQEIIVQGFGGVILVLVLLGVMFSLHWQLSLMLLGLLPCMGGLMRWVNVPVKRYSNAMQDIMGQMTHMTQELMQGIEVIKLCQAEKKQISKISTTCHSAYNLECKIVWINAFANTIVQWLGALILTALVMAIYKGLVVIKVGQLGGIIGAMAALIKPLKQLSQVNVAVQKGFVAVQGLEHFLHVENEVNLGTKKIERAQGLLEFNNVSFAYKQQDFVLQDINLVIKPGQKVAVIGASGSGKTTLAALLTRFYQPSKGQILLDGININAYDLQNLRSHFALVGQNVFLFAGTIAENIAYGLKVSTQELVNAAKIAQAYDFITQLPQGFNTHINENGSNLSGGQKQRITIARAILQNAPILILDEASAALDNQVEYQLNLGLAQLMRERTSLIITHKLATIEQVDHIVVLQAGRVVEEGSHIKLMQQQGVYSSIKQQDIAYAAAKK